jgi:FkbM family methyltransferase
LKESGHRLGVDLSRHRPLASRRATLIDRLGIEVALDVGANIGQYGRDLRSHGFSGDIVSFEPVSSAFARLSAAAAGDPAWTVHNLALGEVSARATIHVTSNVASSSLLPMLERGRALAPDVAVTADEQVEIAVLDEIALPREAPILLKLDVQGYEDRVLRGASRTLGRVELVECELSVVEFYDGQPTLNTMLSLLASLGFDLVDLEPGQRGIDGSISYVDGLLIRSARI